MLLAVSSMLTWIAKLLFKILFWFLALKGLLTLVGLLVGDPGMVAWPL